MARPKVVAEVRREVPNRPPPPNPTPHEWLSKESLDLFEGMSRSEKAFDIYLSTHAERRMRFQAVKAAPNRLEVMGLLLGEVNRWEGRDYVMVRGVGTTDLENTPAKVRFDPDALPGLFRDLDGAGFDYVIVGWYHSHPGHTCFLSRTDMHTQRTLFDQPYHCALVVDPVIEEIKAFKLSGDGYSEVPFAMIREDGPRMRTLKSDAQG
jgi:26S proteasome regulatory subunit N11